MYGFKNKNLARLLGSLLVVASFVSNADDDLLRIYETALTMDPEFQQALATLRAAEEQLPQARAGLRPNVSATAGLDSISSDSDLATSSDSSSDTYQQVRYGITLRQPLYRYDQSRLVDQAGDVVDRAAINFRFAEQALVLRVAERYFATLDAEESVKAAEANLEAIRRQLEQAEERFQVGVIARTDVEEARARADIARADLLEAEDQLNTQREAIRQLTNQDHHSLAPVGEEVSLAKPDPSSVDRWRQLAETDNLELLAARLTASAAMTEVDIQRGGDRPQIDLIAGFSGSEQFDRNGQDLSANELRAGIELSIPLYQGGLTSSRIREAQSQYTVALESLEQVRRTVNRDTADAYRGVITALERIKALDQARASTRSALKATEAGFEVGTRTIVDVLNAQREVFNAERNYQQARHAYFVNSLRLQLAAGTLSIEDLIDINRLLVRSSN